MSDFLQRIKDLPQQRLVLLAAQLQERLEEAQARTRDGEPIAVVGVGCRFPGGADDPESYWELLIEGRDAVREVPADRWEVDRFYDPDWQADGKMASRWGGFLDQVDRFDARLFGISPREAVTMDPQQRLLLEVTHQALERAGIAPGSLQGTRTGVFLGISATDYLQLQARRGLEAIDGYLASGSAPSVSSGRIAYVLGLQGPALSIDTACSSSLVAVHLAVQALRRGECDAAIGAGVNVILSPVTTIALSKSQMMAPDGRCKTFSAQADGFVRGEGCGVVVLKRLADAQRDGDPIVGVIRGSAINQDGRSNGLTAPNGPAQEAVLSAALADAGVRPDEIGYVETHGTGTKLGDPIEVRALGAAFGARVDGRHLRIGSAKTNIGHLESAAGIAGLIKAMLVLEKGVVPAHLHMAEPSPVIPWNSLPIDVPTANTPWADGQPRLAGVSSFGFSGTNAHVVLEAPPAKPPADATGRDVEVLALSAQSDAALDELEQLQAAHLFTHDIPLSELCATLDVGRDAFAHREAFVVESIDELRAELGARGRGESPRRAARGHVTATRSPRPVWLFTGQGSQYPGMGRDLYDAEPAFARVLDHCDEFLRKHFDLPLLDVMLSPDDQRIHQTGHTQPALFALQVALAELWRSWGVNPAAVMGHSVGEYAAAHVGGLFSLDDGLTLIAHRGRLMQALPAGGRMTSLLTSPDRVAPALAPHAAFVSIAAVNGPESVVISGDADHVQAVIDAIEGQVEVRDLEVSHAFHSPAMEPILDEFAAVASGVTFRDPQVPIVSNVFGGIAGRDRMGTAEYWRRHVREPVQFGPAVAALVGQGHRLFLEVGPNPTLVGMAAREVDEPEVRWVHSLRKGRPELREVAGAVASLWTEGVAFDWQAWHGDAVRRRHILPTYPMQRERFWVDGVAPWGTDAVPAPGSTPIDGLVYEVDWSPKAHPSVREVPPGAWMRPLADAERAVGAVASEIADVNGVAGYDRFLPRLDELSAAYVLDGFRRLGLELRVGDRFAFDTLVQKLKVVRPHHRLLRRMLGMLVEDGWLRSDGDGWAVVRADAPQPVDLSSVMSREFGDFAAELDLVQRCGTDLGGILRGQVDALQVLFPGGSTAQMEGIYRDMPMARTFNELVARAVAELVADLPDGRTLRVLEVGGGSGGTTDSVLPALSGHDVDYLFTDVSAAFTSKARERYRNNPSVRFGTFDASRAPAEQGFAPASVDLVIAANVVHATPELRTTLSNIRSLLAPGGTLVMLEATTRERFADLTVGFTPGWWSFDDTDLRPDYALLTRDQWRGVLADVGFAATAAAPEAVDEPSLRREAVVLATVPDDNAETTPRPSQHWLVVGGGPLGDAVASGLSDGGDTVARTSGDDRTTVHQAIAATPPAGVVLVVEPPALDAPTRRSDGDLRDEHRYRTSTILATVQGLLDGTSAPLWIVTQAAQGVDSQALRDPDGATAWGVGHVVELEHPELRCRRIDLDDGDARDAVHALLRELRDPDAAEPQLAFRGDRRLARRLRGAEVAPHEPVTLDAAGSYVVSGGLRGIGFLVADWLVQRGALHLVLFGRSQPDDATAAAIDRWRADGVDVAVEQADAAADADIARIVERATAMAPVRGVIHGAGTLADAALLRQDWHHFDTVFGPKVFGTASLARHLDLGSLDFLVLFASGAGVGGSAGQANHSAANAYLDAVAHHLRAGGVKVTSIDWGAWTRVGAAADRGIDDMPGAFTPEQGLAVLDHVIASLRRGEGPAQLLVHSADWSDVRGRFADGTELSLYRDLFAALRGTSGPTADVVGSVMPTVSLREKLHGLPERRRRLVVRDEIRRLAARVLDVDDPEQIEVGQPLHDIGLDSLMAVELRNMLGMAIGSELPATLLFEHPSVTALVDHLLAEHLPAAAVDTVGVLAGAQITVGDGAGDDAASLAAVDVGNGDAPSAGTDDIAAALAARLDRLGGGA